MESNSTLNSDLSETASCIPSEPASHDFIFNDKQLFYVLNVTGIIWIRGKEITDILLYDNSGAAISTYVLDGDTTYLHDLKPKISGGGDQEIDDQNPVFLNQSGIYSLALYSKLVSVRCFISWFTKIVIPSIEKLGDKFENESRASTNKACEITEEENTNLKIHIRENELLIDAYRKHEDMLRNIIWRLEYESRAKNVAMAQQIHDEKVLQRHFRDLILDKRVKTQQYEKDIKKHENDMENMQHIEENLQSRIKMLEFEIQSKDDLLSQKDDYMTEMNRQKKMLELDIKIQKDQLNLKSDDSVKIVLHIQDLESRIQAQNQELERQINGMIKMRTDLNLLKDENAELKIQAGLHQPIAAEYRQFLRRQDTFLHLLMKNFVPKLYDRKLEEEFIVFRLNLGNFFTHYAVRIRIRYMSQQIKIIQARYPNSVELFRIACYPTTINLLKLMKNHLQNKIQFMGNYFTVLSDEYTDSDLRIDVLKLFDEADSVRQDIFKRMDIEQYFRKDENISECTACADEDEEGFTDQNQDSNSALLARPDSDKNTE